MVKEVRKEGEFLREFFLADGKTEENYAIKNTSANRLKRRYVISDYYICRKSSLHPLFRLPFRNFPRKAFRMHRMMTKAAKRNRFIQKTLQFLPAVFVNIPTFGNLVVGMKILVRAKHVTRRAGVEFPAV